MNDTTKKTGAITGAIVAGTAIVAMAVSGGRAPAVKICVEQTSRCFTYQTAADFTARKNYFAKKLMANAPLTWAELQEMTATINYDIVHQRKGNLSLNAITDPTKFTKAMIKELQD